jgi:hypothetical protein
VNVRIGSSAAWDEAGLFARSQAESVAAISRKREKGKRFTASVIRSC